MPGVLLTGFFRTGSTFLFACLRQVPELMCFYEPYHPLLSGYLDALRDGKEPDKSLLGHTLDGGYFEEYLLVDRERLQNVLAQNVRLTNHPVAAAVNEDSSIGGYIDFLLTEAERKNRVGVLQCNRWNLLVPWMRVRYPKCLIGLITRSPREIASSLAGIARKEGQSFDLWSAQREFWEVNEAFRNIVNYFEVKDSAVWNLNFYQKLYFVVRFGECVMSADAHHLVSYRDFGANPVVTLRGFEKYLELDLGAAISYASKNWRGNAPRIADSPFWEQQEEKPNQILQDWILTDRQRIRVG